MIRRRSTVRATTVGTSYRSAIYFTSDEQKAVALDTIADVDASGLWPGKVVTEVEPAGDFWEAEPEHQDYLRTYPARIYLPFSTSELGVAAQDRCCRLANPRLAARRREPSNGGFHGDRNWGSACPSARACPVDR